MGPPLRLLPSPILRLTHPAEEAHIPAGAEALRPSPDARFSQVSASTRPTRLGMRCLSGLRTEPTEHHIPPGAGAAPRPQAGPTSLLGKGAQILLDPTQHLVDKLP